MRAVEDLVADLDDDARRRGRGRPRPAGVRRARASRPSAAASRSLRSSSSGHGDPDHGDLALAPGGRLGGQVVERLARRAAARRRDDGRRPAPRSPGSALSASRASHELALRLSGGRPGVGQRRTAARWNARRSGRSGTARPRPRRGCRRARQLLERACAPSISTPSTRSRDEDQRRLTTACSTPKEMAPTRSPQQGVRASVTRASGVGAGVGERTRQTRLAAEQPGDGEQVARDRARRSRRLPWRAAASSRVARLGQRLTAGPSH